MFGFGKKKEKKDKEMEALQKEYKALMEQARDIQRKGDIQGFAAKSDEAEQVAKKIDALRAKRAQQS